MKDHLNELTVLLTAAEEDAEEPIRLLEGRGARVLHLPLEQYHSQQPNQQETLNITAYDNIVYGYKRNALYLMEYIRENGLMDQVRQCVNLARDKATANYLEEQGIPAIYPGHNAKPIDLIEFMMRLQRLGPTLYPCGSHQKEEMPGLLQELDIEVKELVCYDRSGPEAEDLDTYRDTLNEYHPNAILFHSRSSVNRVLAAFPDLREREDIIMIAGNAGAAQKMKGEDLPVSTLGNGNWHGMVEALAAITHDEQEG